MEQFKKTDLEILASLIDKMSRLAFDTATERNQVDGSTSVDEFIEAIRDEVEELNDAVVKKRETPGRDVVANLLEKYHFGLVREFKTIHVNTIKDSRGDEIADIILTCLSLARFSGVQIGELMVEKFLYNSIRDGNQ